MRQQFTLKPVYGDDFVGRKDILREMAGELSRPESTLGFCLHGRRRVGKTSILAELERELSGKREVVVASLSLYDLADLSLRTFTEELSAAVLEAFRKKGALPFEYTIRSLMESPKEVVDSALSKIKIGTETSEELKFFLEFKKDKSGNHTEAVKRSFGLGERLALETKTKFILVLDEFPEVLKIENGLQVVKMLRTLHEKHRRTAIVISGSDKRTLEMVALGDASPFSWEETAEFIDRYGIRLSEADAKKLYELTAGMPFYLQFIGRSVTISRDLDRAISEFISEEGNLFFSEEYGRLSEKEKSIARAMAKGAVSPTGIAEGSGEPVTSVSSYLVSLQDKGAVKKTGKGEYALQDALFAFWLKERYTGTKIA